MGVVDVNYDNEWKRTKKSKNTRVNISSGRRPKTNAQARRPRLRLRFQERRSAPERVFRLPCEIRLEFFVVKKLLLDFFPLDMEKISKRAFSFGWGVLNVSAFISIKNNH